MNDETTVAGARDWAVLRGWHAKNRIGNCRTCGNAWPCWAIQATDAIGAAEVENARLRERVAALEATVDGAFDDVVRVVAETAEYKSAEWRVRLTLLVPRLSAALAQADDGGRS